MHIEGYFVDVAGDAVVSSIVAKSEEKLNLDIFNNPDAGIIEGSSELHIDEVVEQELAKRFNKPMIVLNRGMEPGQIRAL